MVLGIAFVAIQIFSQHSNHYKATNVTNFKIKMGTNPFNLWDVRRYMQYLHNLDNFNDFRALFTHHFKILRNFILPILLVWNRVHIPYSIVHIPYSIQEHFSDTLWRFSALKCTYVYIIAICELRAHIYSQCAHVHCLLCPISMQMYANVNSI